MLDDLIGCLDAVDSDDASAKFRVTNLFSSLSVVKIRKLGLVILGVSDQLGLFRGDHCSGPVL